MTDGTLQRSDFLAHIRIRECGTMTDGTLQLNGYICACCGTRLAERAGICPSCFNTSVLVPDFVRQTTLLRPGGRRVSANELAGEDQKTFALEPYSQIKVQRGAFGLVFGPPNCGKTTGGILLASGRRPSVFVSAEMGAGPALAGYLRRLEVRAPDLTIVEAQSTAEIFDAAASGIRTLVIDSLSVLTLLPDDLTAMAKGNNIVVIGLMQVTKDGAARGSNEWIHAADFIIECQSMRWRLTKSRFQETANVAGEVLA
jgi:predicted ATP-dependent serine protease